MSATEPFYRLIGITSSQLTKEERLLLEAEIFIRICGELKEIFRKHYRDYFCLMKFTIEMENNMLESQFARLIIQDILATGEYNLAGVAQYTNSYEEVVEEIMTGLNLTPSAIFMQKLIELHRSVRRELYTSIIKKVAENYLAVA